MTYSIVARDPDDGSLGVGVQSAWFAVGHIVPWVNAGVGVVATQGAAEPSYGPRGLTLMRNGLSARRTLEALLELDDAAAHRQVAMIDANGEVATHTGNSNVEFRGHATGHQVSCQGNLLRADGIPDAMLRAYEATPGPLVTRLLAALDAAQDGGGDARGQQSAALLVVSGTGQRDLFNDRLFDIRVDDHPSPLAELTRIVDVQRAYRLMDLSESRRADGELDAAAELAIEAAHLLPGETNVVLTGVITLLAVGRRAEAADLAATRDRDAADWPALIRRWSVGDPLPDGVDAERLVELFAD